MESHNIWKGSFGIKRFTFCLFALVFLASACASGSLMDAQHFLSQLRKAENTVLISMEDMLAEETPDGFCYSAFFSFPQEKEAEDSFLFLLRLYTQEDGHLKRCTLTYTLQEGEDADALTAKTSEHFRHLCAAVTAAYTKCDLQTADTLLKAHFQEEKDALCSWEENWFRYALLETALGFSFTLESVRLNPADKDALTLRDQETALSSAASPSEKP